MAIRRVTIELDDSADNNRTTTVPTSLTKRGPIETKKRDLTDVTVYEEKVEEAEPPEGAPSVPITIGRTFPDLVSEFINNPRAMATILMFAPFIVFVVKIDSTAALKYPVITGAILNAVWFGIPVLMSIWRWLRKVVEVRQR